jgi:phage shock protein A
VGEHLGALGQPVGAAHLGLAEVDREHEIHPIHARGHRQSARMLDRRQPGGLVDQLHDDAAVDVAHVVRVGDTHQMREHRAGLGDRLGIHAARILVPSLATLQEPVQPPAKEDAMPGLSGRMSTVVKAKISKLLDRAEDPSETLEYSYQKQIELLQNVKKGIADVVTSKKRLQLQEEKIQQSVVKLDTQARQALSAGNEELARVALERKNVAQTELQSLDSQITQLEQQQEQMTASEQKLRTKIEQFRSKKEVVKAQYSAAEAQVRISEAATGVGDEMADVGLAMQRALDKTENMKARADAVQELEAAGTFEDLTALGSGDDDIDRQLKQLSSTSEVDTDLAKLKAELGMGTPSPKGELGAGDGEAPAAASAPAPADSAPAGQEQGQ